MPASRPIEERFWEKVNRRGPDECWLWRAALNYQGYGNIGFGNRTWLSHRLSWVLHHGIIPDGIKVLHRCDTPACVNPGHLFLGTQADNMRDMIAKGRGQYVVPRDNRGARNPMAKLSDDDVREIRELAAQLPQRRIAERFGIHPSHVSKLVSGERR